MAAQSSEPLTDALMSPSSTLRLLSSVRATLESTSAVSKVFDMVIRVVQTADPQQTAPQAVTEPDASVIGLADAVYRAG